MKILILLLASSYILPLWFGVNLKAANQFEKETVTYKQVDSLDIKADIYHYNDAKVRPVVVSLHGGALIMGHRESFSGPVKDFALTNRSEERRVGKESSYGWGEGVGTKKR